MWVVKCWSQGSPHPSGGDPLRPRVLEWQEMSLLFWAQSEDQARCSSPGPHGPLGPLRCPGHRYDLPREALLLGLRQHLPMPVGSNLASDQRMQVTHPLSAHGRNRWKRVGCVAVFRFHEASVRVGSTAATALCAALATAPWGCQEPRSGRCRDRADLAPGQRARHFPLKADGTL